MEPQDTLSCRIALRPITSHHNSAISYFIIIIMIIMFIIIIFFSLLFIFIYVYSIFHLCTNGTNVHFACTVQPNFG